MTPPPCKLCGVIVKKRARGLCDRCRHHETRLGRLDLYERTNRPSAELVETWEELHDQGYTMRDAAERIGVTKGAIEKAITRVRQKEVA